MASGFIQASGGGPIILRRLRCCSSFLRPHSVYLTGTTEKAKEGNEVGTACDELVLDSLTNEDLDVYRFCTDAVAVAEQHGIHLPAALEGSGVCKMAWCGLCGQTKTQHRLPLPDRQHAEVRLPPTATSATYLLPARGASSAAALRYRLPRGERPRPP
jgi:hypothetical protein